MIRAPTDAHKHRPSLIHGHTHIVPGEKASEVRALRGSSFLNCSLVITSFGNTGSPGSSTLKELLAVSPPPTHRITLHCWQVWNSPLELLQALAEKKSRPEMHLRLSAAGPPMERWVTVWEITLLFRLSRQRLLRKQVDLELNYARRLRPNVQTATLLLLHLEISPNSLLSAVLIVLQWVVHHNSNTVWLADYKRQWQKFKRPKSGFANFIVFAGNHTHFSSAYCSASRADVFFSAVTDSHCFQFISLWC